MCDGQAQRTASPELNIVPEPGATEPQSIDPTLQRPAARRDSRFAPGLFEQGSAEAPVPPRPGAGRVRAEPELDPLPDSITGADVLRELAELGAPPAIMAEAESFGEDVAALAVWLEQFQGDDSAEQSLPDLLEHWKVLLKRGTTPLDAELCAAEFLSMFDAAIGGLDLVVGLTQLIEEAATTGSPEALAMCRAFAHLGPGGIRPVAKRAARTLAVAGAKDMPWVNSLGQAEFIDAYGYSDSWGAQQSIGLEFRYGKRRHVLVLLIDRELGGGIKDCFVSDDPTRLFAEMRIQALQTGLRLGPHTPEQASRILHSALAAPPCPAMPDQQEDVDNYLPLVRERARTMPVHPGPARVRRLRSDETQSESKGRRRVTRSR